MKHGGTPFSIANALRVIYFDTLLLRQPRACTPAQRRAFHEYFVTHLPSSSLAPDRRHQPGSHHKLPRDESQPHAGSTSRRSAANLPDHTPSRDTTIVRIPIRNAKHHFGAGVSRGSRPYNEDTYQTGTIEIPAFAKRQPVSLSRRNATSAEAEVQAAKSESGDPQVFYFGVFDGHGGSECSEFLRDRLHGYIEEAALLFGMQSTLQSGGQNGTSADDYDSEGGVMGEQDSEDLQKSLVSTWKETVGGYFKRFRPEYFPAVAKPSQSGTANSEQELASNSIETVLTYAFLKADLDFTAAQASKHTEQEKPSSSQSADPDHDPVLSDRPLNDHDILYHPDRPASQNLSTRQRPSSSPDLSAPIGGATRFKGGSTASIALISTPTPTPFWHPASPSTLIAAHVGDTRILLCRTSDGKAAPLTTNHHPSTPVEANRLRRYAASFTTDSFGEERVLGLANTRAFGDIASKRIGVSAEPQITRIDIPAAGKEGYSFIVLMSDGVSGHLEDQEIVDVVKEAKTPAQAAEDVVSFAVETSEGGDNATCLVVRLGGWERRSEGGGGSLGTKEQRQYRKEEAMDPRRSKM